MKTLALVFLLFILSANAWAKAGRETVKIVFKDKVKSHTFSLWSDPKAQSYKLTFRAGEKAPQVKVLSQKQAELIENEVNQIVWISEYRKPVNSSNCSLYVSLIFQQETSRVCLENKAATGRAYGLLNSLRQLF